MIKFQGSLLISRYQGVFFMNEISEEEARKRALQVIEQWIKEEECRSQLTDINEQEVLYEK